MRITVLDSKPFIYRGWEMSACINPESFIAFAQNSLTGPFQYNFTSYIVPQIHLSVSDIGIFIVAESFCQNKTALFLRNACIRGIRRKGKRHLWNNFPTQHFLDVLTLVSFIYICTGAEHFTKTSHSLHHFIYRER